jgi:hypothetical protein
MVNGQNLNILIAKKINNPIVLHQKLSNILPPKLWHNTTQLREIL